MAFRFSIGWHKGVDGEYKKAQEEAKKEVAEFKVNVDNHLWPPEQKDSFIKKVAKFWEMKNMSWFSKEFL